MADSDVVLMQFNKVIEEILGGNLNRKWHVAWRRACVDCG
jgi:hypothetical protein